MIKISNNIGFDACLVLPIDFHYKHIFWWQSHDTYNHAVLIVGGFLCWEEIKCVMFTVDHEVAPLTL